MGTNIVKHRSVTHARLICAALEEWVQSSAVTWALH
jgi:hypothetical protein